MKTSPGRVVLVDNQYGCATQKTPTCSMHDKLRANDFLIVDTSNRIDGFVSLVATYKPNVLVLSITKLDTQTLEELKKVHRLSPVPVIVCVKEYTAAQLPAMAEAGINAYISDDVKVARLPVVIDLAIARFTHLLNLNSQLRKTQEQLSERKLVEKAKGVLMQQKGLSEADAYAQMRKSAMNKGQSIAALSKQIITVFELIE